VTTTTTGSSLEHAIGRDGLFSLGFRHGSARLRAVDGEVIRIRDRDDRDLASMFAIDLAEGSVALRATRDSDIPGHRGRGGVPDLEIELPRRATIVLEAASGDIEAEGTLGDQRYRTTSGDVTLRGVSGRIAIEAASGEVDIASFGDAHVVVRTVSGDVELRAGTLLSLEAATTSGDLKIAGRLAGTGPFSIVTVSGDTLLAPAGDLRIEMVTLSGDLHSDVGGRSEGGRGRRSFTIGSGGPLVSVRSLSGDLNVVRPRPVASATEAQAGTSQTEARTDVAASTTPAAGPPSDTAPTAEPDPIPPAMATARADDPAPAPAPVNGALAAAYDDARLRILRSLERGEIDVAEAGRRLEALDAGDPDPGAETARVPDADRPDA
jgi:hypothetical protein